MVAAPVAPVATPIDLSPVAEPADIFVTARWKNPKRAQLVINDLGTAARIDVVS